MIVTCPDCGGKIPDTEQTCPICGSALDVYSVAPQIIADDEIPEQQEVKLKSKSLVGIFFRRIFELILFLLICSVIALVVLMTDFLGARTSLRKMCMTDSGSGSASDTQILRVEVKHHILTVLDWIDHGGNAQQIKVKKKKDPIKVEFPEAKVKVKREPLELPPDPPKIQSFDEANK